MNSTAVHRLYVTRELVPLAITKDFLKLEILMGTQRSHAAYRLAWKNTSGNRIPFLPLHLRDLATVSEGSSTVLGKAPIAVNWKKIEILGDIAMDMQNVLHTPYSSISDNFKLRTLIIDINILKDEDVSIGKGL